VQLGQPRSHPLRSEHRPSGLRCGAAAQ
jgi:hypothetical protein